MNEEEHTNSSKGNNAHTIQQQHIEEQINFMEEEGMQFDVDFMESENKSIEFDQSKILFKKDGITVNKFGARGTHRNQATVEINPDLIQEQKKIGKGSAGEVWLATYHPNGPDGEAVNVAIKQIPVDQKQSRDQFVQDLKAFLNCDCPYIVKFYGCYYKEGYLNQVIEYMNMGSLRQLINFNIKNGNSRPLQSVLAQLSYCILEGLHYIHKKKHQIHRDIKPQNILINNLGEIKITDFGICKQLQKTYGLSRTWVGTHIYMSPQRIDCKQYSSNCDVWSFGLVLYELATCKELPYRKTNHNQSMYLLMQKIKNSPVPTFEKEDDRSPQFCHFLSRCLQKDPKTRASVEQLLQHPWLTKNRDQKILRQYIKMVQSMRKKNQKSG